MPAAALEDEHCADVHVRRLPLLVQERRVDRRQAVEMLLGHTWSVPNCTRFEPVTRGTRRHVG